MIPGEGWWLLGSLILLAVVCWWVYLMGREAEHAAAVERAEVRWWCRFDNEFGPLGRAHPYCYPRHMAGHREHQRCGWGTWTPRHAGYSTHGEPVL